MKQVVSINDLELLAVCVAALLWMNDFPEGSRISFRTDNTTTIRWFEKQYARSPLASRLLRFLFFKAAGRNIEIRLVHIPGYKNIFADMLSRLQIQTFILRATEAGLNRSGSLCREVQLPDFLRNW
jgi:hypothetical protein